MPQNFQNIEVFLTHDKLYRIEIDFLVKWWMNFKTTILYQIKQNQTIYNSHLCR